VRPRRPRRSTAAAAVGTHQQTEPEVAGTGADDRPGAVDAPTRGAVTVEPVTPEPVQDSGDRPDAGQPDAGSPAGEQPDDSTAHVSATSPGTGG